MFRRLLSVILAAFVLTQPTGAALAATRVTVSTSQGDFVIELWPKRAPGTVANFLRYVDRGFYDGGVFHRAVTLENQSQNQIKIEVVQGGINPAHRNDDGPTIALERTRDTGLRHRDGTISMARLEPDTATSDFFICVNAQPELDFGGKRNPDGQGFAAFGQVVRGMEAVRAIQQAPVERQTLSPPIKIISMKRATL